MRARNPRSDTPLSPPRPPHDTRRNINGNRSPLQFIARARYQAREAQMNLTANGPPQALYFFGGEIGQVGPDLRAHVNRDAAPDLLQSTRHRCAMGTIESRQPINSL